jgi:stage V sporulation protein AF
MQEVKNMPDPNDPKQQGSKKQESTSKGKGQVTQPDVPVPSLLEEVKSILKAEVGLDHSFDVIFREMQFGGKKAAFFYLNGFMMNSVMTDVIYRLTLAPREAVAMDTVNVFMKALIPHSQVAKHDKMKDVIGDVMVGQCALFIEGETSAITIDVKIFPTRSTEEPDLERVVRGARDGFLETLMTNVTLIRRRIRDTQLKMEMLKVGKRTHTDVCIAYIEDIADPSMVEAIRDKINAVDLDGLPLAEKQLEEMIVHGNGWQLYPFVRYSERPDVIAAHLLEGHVVVIVDTSPSVMILPTTFFHHLQHAEEFRQSPIVGTYLRWIRFVGVWMSLFLMPLWLNMVLDPSMKPQGLEFIGPNKTSKLPILVQFLIAEVGIDLMRMASIHTPSPLAIAMGLVAAILVGDIAIKTGLFVNEVILYLSISTVGMFATPSYELSLANRIIRLVLLVVVAAFKAPGLVIASTIWLITLTLRRSFNTPYMWPFIPFNAKGMWAILIRKTVKKDNTRLSLTKPIDSTRQQQSE